MPCTVEREFFPQGSYTGEEGEPVDEEAERSESERVKPGAHVAGRTPSGGEGRPFRNAAFGIQQESLVVNALFLHGHKGY